MTMIYIAVKNPIKFTFINVGLKKIHISRIEKCYPSMNLIPQYKMFYKIIIFWSLRGNNF